MLARVLDGADQPSTGCTAWAKAALAAAGANGKRSLEGTFARLHPHRTRSGPHHHQGGRRMTPYPHRSPTGAARPRSACRAFCSTTSTAAPGDERTLAANVQDFAALRLRQRVLVDVAQVDARAPLADQPARCQRWHPSAWRAWPRAGERRRPTRAAHAGVPFALHRGHLPHFRVAAAADRLSSSGHAARPRRRARALLDGAWAAGCRTLVFTVDLPLPGMRHDIRHGMAAKRARPALIRAALVLHNAPGLGVGRGAARQPLRFWQP